MRRWAALRLPNSSGLRVRETRLAGDDDGRNRRRSAARSRLVIAWHARSCEPTRARAALPRAERGEITWALRGLRTLVIVSFGSCMLVPRRRRKSALTSTADVMRSRHKRRDGPKTEVGPLTRIPTRIRRQANLLPQDAPAPRAERAPASTTSLPRMSLAQCFSRRSSLA
jgi:hypothetical protein